MKTIRFWSIIMLVVVYVPMMMSCGDDDENGTTQKIDGVNVNKGKKLVELSIDTESQTLPLDIKINYDSQGRMCDFLYNVVNYKNDYNSYEYTGEFKELLNIDYDMHIVRYGSNNSSLYGFTLNKDGYICQLGTISFKYDTNGYLQEIEDAQCISTIGYNENEIIKASATNFKSGNVTLYFVTYGNMGNTGELYVRIERNDKSKHDKYNNVLNAMYFLIAYQSGLFGKVSKRILNLKNEREKNAFLDYIKGDIIKFNFVWQ